MRLLLFLSIILLTGCQSDTLFERLDNAQTNIDFENKLTETEQQNILSYEYFYNGGGVAAADFNNDGLTDLYFSANQLANKLYLNTTVYGKEVSFKDVTAQAGVAGKANAWKTGVAVADVNGDGWLDIYLCYSGNGNPETRKNQLFINNGISSPSLVERGPGGEVGVSFTEQAEAYGIADTGYTTHATFFDYDVDGDLDLFVMNHNLKGYQRKEAAAMKSAIDANAGDRLYKNSPLTPNGGTHFLDVTQSAGIKSNPLGFGLGVVVSDFNHDNFPDLYVANDYVEEDYLYYNQGDGSFKEVGKELMGHFSYSSMGVDVADINNDGYTDIFTADMLPEDSKRQKLLAFPDNWNVQQSMLDNGFHWQNMRNMLQVANPNGAFSEIAQLAGVSATDWSWSPLFADFDNDGYKDLFVSNGFVRDLTDLDFVKYYLDQETRAKHGESSASLLNMAKQMPSTPTHHYIFKNNGDLTFSNQVKDWGFDHQTIACGAVYADLDNDGDLDLITNNTNSPASIYLNKTQEKSPQNYLKVQFQGDVPNVFGLGAKLWIHAAGKTQYYENTATHGFQSSIATPLNIGLGKATKIDSLKVIWTDGRTEKRLNVSVNQSLTLQQSKSVIVPLRVDKIPALLEENNVVDFRHQENPFVDFNRQILLPRLYSRTGPRFAQGDVNGDGLTDFFIPTPKGQNEVLYLQTVNSSFQAAPFPVKSNPEIEAVDAVFVDIDADKDLDLLVASGGYEQVLEDKIFEDRLFLNDGKGNFQEISGRIPSILTNKSCLKILDYDHDKDMDIFVGGTVRVGLYPYSDPSYLLKNDGKGNFSVAQKFETGLVTDVAVADIDADTWQDIVLVGEFMPVQVLKNQKGKFTNPSDVFEAGWYSRIVANDLDNDGDMDFILGNLGLNTPLKASKEKPLQLFYGDADENGTIEPFIANYFGEKAYPIAGRDEALEQLVSLKKRFTDYKSYSETTIDKLFGTPLERLSAQQLKTGILWNNKGKLVFEALPTEAQVAPVYAILVTDLNHDGNKDILLAGNNASFRTRIGKTDANAGLVLLGAKNKIFKAISQNRAGLYLQGDVRDILQINKQLFFGLNDAKLKTYRLSF